MPSAASASVACCPDTSRSDRRAADHAGATNRESDDNISTFAPTMISNISDTTAAARPLTSDMISFTATVVRAPTSGNTRPSTSSGDVWTPKPSDIPPPGRRRRRFTLHRKDTQEEEENCQHHKKVALLHQSRPFSEIKIESTVERMSSELSKNGYMYSRGSFESDPTLMDRRNRYSSATNRGSRVRAWSRALSVSHDSDRDASTIAAMVTATPDTVWNTFLKTVGNFADEPALSGREFQTNVNFSWAQHAVRVRCVARAFSQLGFCTGDGVIVTAQMSPLLQAVNLATVSLGGVVSHVRSSWSARELRDEIFPIAKATIVVVDTLKDNFREALEALDDQPDDLRPSVRAVVVLGGFDATDRAVASLHASINVIGAEDLVAINSLATNEAAMTPSIESLACSVMPDQCCFLGFDYDALGRVRAAELSHDNVLFTAAALVRSFGLNIRDRLVGYLPLHHVASQILEFYVPLVAGLSVVCAPTYDRPLVRVVTDHKPTVFFATPATWTRFSEQVYRAKGDVNAAIYRWAKIRATNNSQKLLFARGKGAKHRSLGYMLAKALVLNNIKKKVGLESCTACYSLLAPLDFELERLFKTVDTPIYQLFGTAETCGFAAINFPHAWEFGSSGRALPGTTIRCDERSQETVLRGRNVFMGYRYAPNSDNYDGSDQFTSSNNSDGWLRLRQRAFLTPTGFLRLSDPRDFLVLSTGDWVPVHPFEFAMKELMPELDRAVLVGDGRTFLSALFFLKTSTGTSRIVAGNNKHASGRQLDEDALQVGHAIGSPATTVGEAIRCQQWAVHFDWVLEKLPQVCCVSGSRVRKWILMAADFSVESGELDPDTGDVCRRAVDRKYQALLDSLYS
ncbi:long-chain-fatty-acid-CoA ligase, putative [Phytophthora infestans T30-4]|uniref:Long-chain-fatty-acid-CoA ligase, putative n=1 Tax=Phytophthora infestans (strain T30-4) TaxID=403677 RepID=D0NGM3_PHYIT|nr:long-chain-fatty-acid-CoA ligase, putative [Phytophthora infestans T30-4]EEY57424.1 long-chain-fatty-acid-CoA ligase, putative [Phytophthora infestans T30-4]|eukprot:XP_002902034.1 long-chain-fatty-acid-CoA ligase, putative [Phytophthora infestans T30-4]